MTDPILDVTVKPVNPTIVSSGVIAPTFTVTDCPDIPITSAGLIEPTETVDETPVGIIIGFEEIVILPIEDDAD